MFTPTLRQKVDCIQSTHQDAFDQRDIFSHDSFHQHTLKNCSNFARMFKICTEEITVPKYCVKNNCV